MMHVVQTLFSLFLSFTLVVTSAPFGAIPKAHANTEVSDDGSAEMDQSLQELQAALTEEGVVEAHLDPFLLTRQMVMDNRSERVEALEKERLIEDYDERIQYLEENIASLNRLEQDLQGRVNALQSQGNGQELPAQARDSIEEFHKILADIDSRRRLMQLDLEDMANFDPRQGTSLPVDLMIDKQLSTRHYWGNRMRLQLTNHDEPMSEISQREFTESLSPRFSRSIENYVNEDEEVRFTITDRRGRPMHAFRNPVSAVTFFGSYLVYIEKQDSLNPGDTLPVRFIDLNYARPNLGNAPLPVFTLPLKFQGEKVNMEHEQGRLRVGDVLLSHQQLAMLSNAKQVLFNVSVALVDPDSHDNAQPLIDQVTEFFTLSMRSQDQHFQQSLEAAVDNTKFLKDMEGSLNARQARVPENAQTLIESALADGKVTSEEFEKIQTLLNSNQSIVSANEAVANGRRFMSRMKMLMSYLVQPRVEGAPKLFNTMVMLAAPQNDSERGRAFEHFKNGLTFKLAKYGGAVGGVLLAGDYLPEPYKINLYKSLDLISAVGQHFMGYLQHMNYGAAYGELATDAVITSTTGWTYFVDSYLSEGKWPQFLYGVGRVLLVPLQFFASVHFTVNGYKMFRKTIEARRLSKNRLGFLQAFKQAARKDQAAYWGGLAEAEKQVSGSDVEQITKEHEALLDDHIQRLNQGRDGLYALERDIKSGRYGTQSGLRTFVSSLAGFKKYFHFGEKVSGVFQKATEILKLKGGKNTLRKALANSFLSYSALRSTFFLNSNIWNVLFMTRSYVWTPHKLSIFLLYPNYFRAATSSVPGKQHFPSDYNNGLETLPVKLQRLISSTPLARPLSKVPGINKLLYSKEALENLKYFESSVIELETAAMAIAKTKAQMALMENIKDPERLMVIFDSAQDPTGVTTGVRRLNDKKIKKLTRKERLFYRAYFTRSFDLIMQRMLVDVTDTNLSAEMDPKAFAKAFRKQVMSDKVSGLQFDKVDLKSLTKQLEGQLDFERIRRWSQQLANNGESFFTKAELQFRHNVLQSMDPRNPQVRRFLISKNKSKEPRAMERAMRMEVSSMVSTIPLALMSSLALYAGVQTGLIRPFDPEAMNSETHFAYMSRYLFYSSFVPGVVLGMMANTWMKLQEDNRIDSMGGFDRTLMKSDGKKGFWRYYLKNLLKNPVNKWKDNHIHYLKLITANIPAAAITIMAFHLYGMGRFDLGIFLSGYILIYTLFLTGFDLKISQAFELAGAWVYDRIPRRLRAHPKAQKYVNDNLQMKKIGFTFFENLWSVVVIENIAGEMLTLKDNVKYGTRAFLRVTFGGDTPTEIMSGFLNTLSKTFSSLPGASSVFDGLNHFISNNYEAFDRFPERLPVVEGVPQVDQNPGLPDSPTGEVIGKGLGITTFWGGVASIPFVISSFLQRWRETKIQIQGEEAMKKASVQKVDDIEVVDEAPRPPQQLRCQDLFSPS